MALTCGFYDSLNGDRKYNAYQMSSLFDGLISDGVYAGIGTGFAVTVTSGMNIAVDSGRAWFDHTWTYNGSKYTMTLEAADALRDRIDAVVLEINSSTAARANTLAIVKGTAATNPVRPTLSKNGTKKQYALAYIRVKAGATSLSQADITYVVGTGETPYVTGVLQSVGIDAQVAQWNAEFNEWFENLKAQLSGNIATNLQNQITALANRTTKIEADYKHLIKLKDVTVSTGGSDILTVDISDISFADYAQVFIDVLALSDKQRLLEVRQRFRRWLHIGCDLCKCSRNYETCLGGPDHHADRKTGKAVCSDHHLGRLRQTGSTDLFRAADDAHQNSDSKFHQDQFRDQSCDLGRKVRRIF